MPGTCATKHLMRGSLPATQVTNPLGLPGIADGDRFLDPGMGDDERLPVDARRCRLPSPRLAPLNLLGEEREPLGHCLLACLPLRLGSIMLFRILQVDRKCAGSRDDAASSTAW